MQKRFLMSSTLILIAGLVVIATIITFTFIPIFYSTSAVKSTEQAKELTDKYLSSLSQNLKVNEIMEFSRNFYVQVQERATGVNAFELLVDRYTSRLMLEPGPNIMWNRKYGMMGSMSNPTASMPLSAQNASQYAQRWLDRNIPSAKTEEPNTFYGYYTIDFSKNDQIVGMLSVNGYTGDVWYHTWHGQFIKMVEYE